MELVSVVEVGIVVVLVVVVVERVVGEEDCFFVVVIVCRGVFIFAIEALLVVGVVEEGGFVL